MINGWGNGNKALFDKYYPKFLFFILLIVLYFAFLKLICQGDPILNLVRLVLILWGLAIAFPVPMLIINREESVFQSVKKGYIAGKYLRWHQINLIALSLFNLPYLNDIFNVWYKKQEEFKLYERDNDY
jgi:hypothetical protein